MTFSFFKKRPDTFDFEAERVCKNCENPFRGNFCNHCGEKVIDAADRSLGRLAESILNAFTFLEGKFWRSFKTMVLNPGKLSDQIRAGVQVPYMRLVGLFFVANFFYFLFPVFDTFNSPLYSQFYYQEYSELVQKLVREHLKAHQPDVETYTQAFNAHTGNLSKLLIVVLVFIFTIPLAVVNFSKKNFYFDHLQLSFEFHAFSLLLSSVLIPLVLKNVILLANSLGQDWNVLLTDGVYSKFSMALFAFFLFGLSARTMVIGGGWQL